jgi:hypothetical protein
MQITFLVTIKRLWDAVGHAGRVKFLYDTAAGTMAWFAGLGLIAILVAVARRPNKEIIRVISPLTLAVVATILATGAWGWVLFDRAKGPIIWTFGDGPHPIFGMRGGGAERPLISTFQLTGNNRSDEPISNIDGFLRSNITNKKLPLFFQINGKYVRTIDTNGVPPHADFMIVVPFTDDQAKFETITIPSDQFLSEYGNLTLSVTFEGRGSPYIRNFPRGELAGVIDEFEKSLRESILQKPTIALK